MIEPTVSHRPISAPLGEVSTGRLDLRRFRPDDLDGLAGVFAYPEVWRFPYGRAFSRQETAAFLDDQIRGWESCGFGCWIARERATCRVIGYVGISVPTLLPEILPAVEVGWRFEPAAGARALPAKGAWAVPRRNLAGHVIDELDDEDELAAPVLGDCEEFGH